MDGKQWVSQSAFGRSTSDSGARDSRIQRASNPPIFQAAFAAVLLSFSRRIENSARQVTLEELEMLRLKFGVDPLLISDIELTDGSLASLGLHLVYVAPKGWAVNTEDVFVYDSSSVSGASQ